MTARDSTRFMACFAPNLRFVDHRTLGWDVGDLQSMATRFRSLTPAGETPADDLTARVVEVHRVAPPLVCLTGAHTLTTPAGAQLSERHVMVSRVDPATGQIDLLEEFPEDGLPEALERFAQLAAETPSGVVSPAVLVGGAVNRRALAGDADALATLLAEGWEATTHDGRRLGRSEVLADPATGVLAGFGVSARHALDVRDERVALVEIDAGGRDGRRNAVDELDLHGRLVATTVFDGSQRDLAADHVDRLTAAPSA